ncbi:MAG: hypothetical protein ACO1PB_11140 [Ramlibacter sp.]
MTAAARIRWRRRDFLWRSAALPLAAGVPAAVRAAVADAAQGLPLPASLQQELATALQRKQALVVMVSLPNCPFCRFVRDSHLVPLRRATGQPVVQVDMQGPQALRDFAGEPTTHGALVRAWKVTSAPTVLFVGPGGREVAPRLVGASIPDFYGAYLEERILAANRAVA